MVSMKYGKILHGVDSARLIAHEPIVHEDNRSPYRLDTPPIQHRLDCARISYAKTIGHQLDCARNGYTRTIQHRLDCARVGSAKTIRHRLDCARIGYAKTIKHQLDCAPLQLCTSECKKRNCLIKSHFFRT